MAWVLLRYLNFGRLNRERERDNISFCIGKHPESSFKHGWFEVFLPLAMDCICKHRISPISWTRFMRGCTMSLPAGTPWSSWSDKAVSLLLPLHFLSFHTNHFDRLLFYHRTQLSQQTAILRIVRTVVISSTAQTTSHLNVPQYYQSWYSLLQHHLFLVDKVTLRQHFVLPSAIPALIAATSKLNGCWEHHASKALRWRSLWNEFDRIWGAHYQKDYSVRL